MPAEEVAERFEEHKVANLPALEGTMDQVASIWNRFASQPTGKPAKFDAFGAGVKAFVSQQRASKSEKLETTPEVSDS